jgi:hypothetical protein
MNLIDALAIKAVGWHDERTKKIYKEAETIVFNHANEVGKLFGKEAKIEPELTEHGHPRRSDSTRWTETEAEIYAAIDLIEVSGAHELLTNAQTKLKEAADLYADWFETTTEKQ